MFDDNYGRDKDLTCTEAYVQLRCCCRLYYKSMTRMETERERLLLAYQANEEIIAGRFPLSRELAVELMALMAQVKFFFEEALIR